jgi:hypothetical protein
MGDVNGIKLAFLALDDPSNLPSDPKVYYMIWVKTKTFYDLTHEEVLSMESTIVVDKETSEEIPYSFAVG